MEMKLEHIRDLAQKPLSEELIPGLLDTGLVVVVATEGTGKTFFGIHAGVHVAAGLKWRGRRVNRGGVVYCIAEGVDFFTYRITTAFDHVGVRAADQPFWVLPHSMNMRAGEDGEITEEINRLFIEIAKLETPPRLIVFDTLNRYMAGGDENSQKDASAFVRGLEFLQSEFKCTVMLMHHMRKGGDLARGSTVFTGAADQVIYAAKSKGALDNAPVCWTTKKVGKRKDREPVEQWFQYTCVPMSKGDMVDYDPSSDNLADFFVVKTAYDDNGDEYETNVVEETLVMEPIDRPEGVPEGEESGAEAVELLTYMKKVGKPIRVRATMDVFGWASRKFYRGVNELVDKELIEKTDDGAYELFNPKKSGNPFL